jgi:predicted naringenin-chalcone synthase
MSLEILAIGTAVPDHAIRQQDAAVLATNFANATPGRERALTALYRRSGIRSRGSVLLENPGERPFAQEFFPPAEATAAGGPSTGERMARYGLEAGRLAVDAARTALSAAAVEPQDVTHLITCSCTGFASPGVDIEILEEAGLSPAVSRTHVGFMGCHGAFNALRVAGAFAASWPAWNSAASTFSMAITTTTSWPIACLPTVLRLWSAARPRQLAAAIVPGGCGAKRAGSCHTRSGRWAG